MVVVVVVGHQIGEDGMVHQSNQRECLLHRLISSGPPHLLRPGWTVITFQTFAISNFWDPAHLFLASYNKSLVSGFGKISVQQGPNVQWPICHQVHSLN